MDNLRQINGSKATGLDGIHPPACIPAKPLTQLFNLQLDVGGHLRIDRRRKSWKRRKTESEIDVEDIDRWV